MTKSLHEYRKVPEQIVIAVLSQKKDGHDKEAEKIKQKTEDFLRKTERTGQVVVMSLASSERDDVKQVVSMANVILLHEITDSVTINDLVRMRALHNGSLMNKFVVIAKDFPEELWIDLIRHGINFFITHPCRPKVFREMLDVMINLIMLQENLIVNDRRIKH